MASPSAYPLPKPKPTPIHTGKALLLKRMMEAKTPPPRPNPVLIKALDKTTSHYIYILLVTIVVERNLPIYNTYLVIQQVLRWNNSSLLSSCGRHDLEKR